MSVPEMRRVQLVLHVEVRVVTEPFGASPDGFAEVQRRLLDVVLGDAELTAFFCRHAAAVPVTDWLSGEPVTGLEWLREEPQRVHDAIRRLAPADQGLFRPVLEGRLDGQLDRFYAAFRPSYRGVQVILIK